MSDPVKIALIAGIAVVAAVAIWVYFSPYHSCLRAQYEQDRRNPELTCAVATGSS